MNIFFSIICFILILLSWAKKQWNLLLLFSLLSLNGALFYFNFFGTRILVVHFISFLSIVYCRSLFGKRALLVMGGLYLEFLFLIGLAFIYAILFPWPTSSRIWSEQPIGRSLVALSRFAMELSIIFFIAYLLWKEKVSLAKILNLSSILVIITSVVALIDWGSGKYYISRFFFDWSEIGWDLVSTRILGFSNEPRIFGRLMVFAWFFLYIFNRNGYQIKYIRTSLTLGLTLILITLSFSAYILFGVLLVTTILSDLKLTVRNIALVSVIGISAIVIINLPQLDSLADIYYKIEMISNGRSMQQMEGEPLFFTRFELFDRVALNHLYNEPLNFFIGTGPNLISIPASKYIDKNGQLQFGESINMIPGVGLINLISRSGLVGLLFFLITFFTIRKSILKSGYRNLNSLNYVNFVGFFIVATPVFYFFNGILLGLLYKDKYKVAL